MAHGFVVHHHYGCGDRLRLLASRAAYTGLYSPEFGQHPLFCQKLTLYCGTGSPLRWRLFVSVGCMIRPVKA
jgi:hypothetical protein